MGIQGLHKGLSFATQKTTLRDFRGKTLAIDASSWLHRSVYSVSEKYVEGLERGLIDEQCVKVSAAYVSSRCRELLEAFQITQIFLVMDGKRCPLKANTNEERERRRQASLSEARQYKRQGRNDKAEEKYKTCIKIKDELTNQVMALVKKNFQKDSRVHLIWSPYEADAQLAKLCVDGVADAVITEDSDVLVYSAACHCAFPVIFKLDRQTGNCDVISMDWLLSSNENQAPCSTAAGQKPPGALESLLRSFASRQNRRPGFGARLFVQGCVLAGCDYAPNKLSGVGLVNAFKYVRDNAFRNDSVRFSKVLHALPRKNKLNIDVQEYELNLAKSEAVFYYHIVRHKDQSKRPLCEPRVFEQEKDTPHCYTHHFPLMERFGADWSFVGESTHGRQCNLTPPTKEEPPLAGQAPPIKEIAFLSRGDKKAKLVHEKKAPFRPSVFFPTKVVAPTRNPYAKSELGGTRKRPREDHRTPLDTINPNNFEVSHPEHKTNCFAKYARSHLPRDHGVLKDFENALGEVRFVKRDFSSKGDRSFRLAGSPCRSEQPSVLGDRPQYSSERASQINLSNDCDVRNAPAIVFEYDPLERMPHENSRQPTDDLPIGELLSARDQFASESLSAPSSESYPMSSDMKMEASVFFDLTDSNPEPTHWNLDDVDDEGEERRRPARVSLDDSIYTTHHSRKGRSGLQENSATSHDFQLPDASPQDSNPIESPAALAYVPRRSKYFADTATNGMSKHRLLPIDDLVEAKMQGENALIPQTKRSLLPEGTDSSTDSALARVHTASILSTRLDNTFRPRRSPAARRPQSGPLVEAFRKQIEKSPCSLRSQDKPWVRSFRPLAGRKTSLRNGGGKIDSYFSIRKQN